MNTTSILNDENTMRISKNAFLRAKELLACFNLSDDTLKNIGLYTAAVIEVGKVMNLTTLKEIDDIIIKHFFDCMFPLLNSRYDLKNKTLIDIGTGAGFPGMPLKFLENELSLSLLETTQKKLNFVSDVNSHLSTDKIEFINMRAEEAARLDDYREKFDYCASRAVAQLNILLELSVPFLKIGGYFFAYKSVKTPEELKEAEKAMVKLGCCLEEIIDYDLPLDMGARSLLVLKKEKSTDQKYPRAFAKIKKQPL